MGDTEQHSVALSAAEGGYPAFPFSPSRKYPEYRGNDIRESGNGVYEAVRHNFFLLGCDTGNYGTAQWNPLGGIIAPGNKVFIKPNLVDHRHRFDDDVWSVITHPSVIRCVLDFVLIALRYEGHVRVGDNPHVDADFDVIRKICFFNELSEYYRTVFNVTVEFADYRVWQIRDLSSYGYKKKRMRLPGDPEGTCTVDIGNHSLLHGISNRLFRGTYEDRRETRRSHRNGRHVYTFSRSMYEADVFISVPKLKAHAKVGATLNIKGLIGTIAEKNALVHWRIGFPACGGDEYPRPLKAVDYVKLSLQHALADILPEGVSLFFRDVLKKSSAGRKLMSCFLVAYQKEKAPRGAAAFNDTTWRTAVDVYRAFAEQKKRRFFSIIDGVTGGDTDGPHFPNPTHPGAIISGEDLLSTDLAAVRLMDYDFRRIRYLDFLNGRQDMIGSIRVVSDDWDVRDYFNPEKKYLRFRPPHRWENLSLHHIAPGKKYHTRDTDA